MVRQMPQNVSESSSEIAKPLSELIPVASVLRPKDNPKAPTSTPPTRQHVIETVQGGLPPMARISPPDPEPKEAKVTGRYRA